MKILGVWRTKESHVFIVNLQVPLLFHWQTFMYSRDGLLPALGEKEILKAWNIDFSCSGAKKPLNLQLLQWSSSVSQIPSCGHTGSRWGVNVCTCVNVKHAAAERQSGVLHLTSLESENKSICAFWPSRPVSIRSCCTSAPSFACWSTASSESVKSEPSTSVWRTSWSKPNSTWCWSLTNGSLSVSIAYKGVQHAWRKDNVYSTCREKDLGRFFIGINGFILQFMSMHVSCHFQPLTNLNLSKTVSFDRLLQMPNLVFIYLLNSYSKNAHFIQLKWGNRILQTLMHFGNISFDFCCTLWLDPGSETLEQERTTGSVCY